MQHLGVEAAHVVGHSIGGCSALQFALDAPDAVRSLALLEPPVLTAVSDRAGARVIGESGQRWQRGDAAGAIDLFMKGVVDPGYQKFFEDVWPDGVHELVRGAKTFFEVDQPSVQGWKFSAPERQSRHAAGFTRDRGRQRSRESNSIAGAALAPGMAA